MTQLAADGRTRPASSIGFFGVAGGLFVVGAIATAVWSASMSGMGGMPMPGESWLAAGVSFVGMWVVMMVAMMMPALMLMLWHYRHAVDGGRVGRLTVLVGIGYFIVWAVLGITVFAVGVVLDTVEMQLVVPSRVVSVAAGVVVILAGVFQFTRWKAHHLDCCREAPRRTLSADWATAIRHGVWLGAHCVACSGGLIAILVVTGATNLWVMGAVTFAITVERLVPHADPARRVIGVIAAGAGVIIIANL